MAVKHRSAAKRTRHGPNERRRPPQRSNVNLVAPDPSTANPARLSKKTLAIITAIAVAFLGAAAGAVVTYIVTPQQAARGEAATEAAHAAFDAKNPSILVRGQRYGGELRSAASPTALDFEALNGQVDAALASGNDLESAYPPPDSISISPLDYVDENSVSQPQVYDTMYITLAGNHYGPVKVNNVTARVVDRRDPPAGTLVYAGPQGASPEESLGFDLDSSDLSARVTKEGTGVPQNTNRHYFDERQITLTRLESIELKLSVFTRTCLCHFVFDIATDDGHVYTADNKGQPWMVSGFAARYARAYAVDVTGPPYIVACEWPTGCVQNY